MSINPMQTLRDDFLSAQLSGQRREALRLITTQGVEQGVDATVLARDVIASSQDEIGRLCITLRHHARALVRIVAQQHDAFPSPPLVVGGHACDTSLDLKHYGVKVSPGDAIAGLGFIERELQGL